MQCFSRTLLAVSIGSAFFASMAQAATEPSKEPMPSTLEQCEVDDATTTQDDPAQQPVHVSADSLNAVNGETATYSGDVQITQGRKKIQADRVTLRQQENTVTADGNVKFSDGKVKAQSDRIKSDLTTNQFELENTQYQFVCQQGRGQAGYIARTGQAYYQLEDGSLTACPEGDDSWRLVASKIEVDQNEETATFYHPRFEVLNVPIAYFPYLTLPVGNTRKSGLLFPTMSIGSKNGFEFEQPIYWNIAPQYDALFNVHYMQHRGTKLDSEFRYLTDGFGSGSVLFEYMPEDSDNKDLGSRWGFQYKHSGIIEQHWKVNVDYSKVKDDDINYFQDLDSNIGNREDGQLLQTGSVSYRDTFWDMTLEARDFQVLVDDNKPYKILPQLTFNYYHPLLPNGLNFDVKTQISQFETQDSSKPQSALRVHVEPGLTLPLATSWGSWTTEARLLATHYHQDIDNVPNLTSLDESVNRVIPEFRSIAQLNFERDTAFFDGYTQTLEPKIQYLYIPDKEQSNIYDYDTTLMQTDYYGLFRTRKYSGIDKIAAANQISYGASTRFFDAENKERLNVSFGQIYYIKKNDASSVHNQNSTKASDYSAWAIEADFNFNDYLFYHGGIQYDIDLASTQLANSTIEYQYDKGFFQTNYRYVTKEYIDSTISFDQENTVTRDGISQLGFVTGYQFSPRWSASAQYYFDLTEHNNVEWLTNIDYHSDCWYVGLTYSNQLRGWNGEEIGATGAEPEYENNFAIRFGITGFSTNSPANRSIREIDTSDNAIKYGRPFYLNN